MTLARFVGDIPCFSIRSFWTELNYVMNFVRMIRERQLAVKAKSPEVIRT
jgi:hypothetical protein